VQYSLALVVYVRGFKVGVFYLVRRVDSQGVPLFSDEGAIKLTFIPERSRADVNKSCMVPFVVATYALVSRHKQNESVHLSLSPFGWKRTRNLAQWDSDDFVIKNPKTKIDLEEFGEISEDSSSSHEECVDADD